MGRKDLNQASPVPIAAWVCLVLSAGLGGYLTGLSTQKEPPSEKSKVPFLMDDGCPVTHKTAALSLGESTVADVASEASKFVVSVEVAAHGRNTAGEPKKAPFFFGPNMRPAPDFPRPHGRFGMGAGIVIRQDGYIVTSSHVTRGADEIKVTLSDGREFMSRVIARDSVTDVCLLKIPVSDLPVCKFADSARTRPGDWTIAIGSPMRLSHSVSLGVVSAVGRSIGDPFSSTDLMQTDAAINPGSSGGPLLNLKGEVIGMSCVVRADAQNIGFAVPSSTVMSVANQLLKEGKVERSYIGVRMIDSVPDSLTNKVKIMIVHVHPGGPAAKAGIKNGEWITAIDGKPVKTFSEVKKLIQNQPAGRKMRISIGSASGDRDVQVVLAPFPSEFIPP